jgi:SNF2 family DNA or RNA helicase
MKDEDWDILITNYETLTPPSQDFTKTGIINWWMSMPDETRNHLFEYWVKQGHVPKDQPNICELEYRTVKGETSVKKTYLDKVYKIIKKIPPASLLSPALVKAQRDLDDLDFLKKLEVDALVLDEGSRIKGHSSQRSQAAMTLASPIKRRYILSGTLCLGNPTDVYMPMTLLDSNIFGTNYYRFEKNYAVYSKYNKHVIIKWKNLDKLKMRMDPYVIERKRSDCLYLPERIVTNRYYTVTREQYELYNEIITQDEIEVEGITINVSIPVIKLNKINQVLNGHLIFPLQRNDSKCNSCEHVITCVEEDIMPWTKHCFKYDPDNLVPKPKREYYELKKNPKAEELLIQDLELTEGKVIIWVYYTYDFAKVKEVLIANKIKFITANEVDCDYKFERDDSYKVFLGQISQGIGITLNSATTTIYYSHGLGLEPRLQSLDRNYRIGQRSAVLVKDYMAEGTVEESIVDLLQHKKDVKDFIQSKVQCQSCKYFIPCFEQGIKPFSQQCIFHGQKVAAEAKHTLKLNELH